MAIEYQLFGDGKGQWIVAGKGVVGDMVATFDGPGAKERANAYGLWMNGKYPVPPPPPVTELTIVDTKGRKIKLVLSGIEWTSDQKRGTVTARTKDNILTVQEAAELPFETVVGERK